MGNLTQTIQEKLQQFPFHYDGIVGALRQAFNKKTTKAIQSSLTNYSTSNSVHFGLTSKIHHLNSATTFVFTELVLQKNLLAFYAWIQYIHSPWLTSLSGTYSPWFVNTSEKDEYCNLFINVPNKP